MIDNKYKGRQPSWDRPGHGLYSDGSIRVITETDKQTGKHVFASHKASDEEVRFIMLYEALQCFLIEFQQWSRR